MNFLPHKLTILRISYENMNRKSTKSSLVSRTELMLTMLQQLQLLAIHRLLRLAHLRLSSSKSHKRRRFHTDIVCQRMQSTLPQYQRHVTNKIFSMKKIFGFVFSRTSLGCFFFHFNSFHRFRF